MSNRRLIRRLNLHFSVLWALFWACSASLWGFRTVFLLHHGFTNSQVGLVSSLALLLPGWFKDPRQLVQGEWQEHNKLGYVEVTDCTARWSGSNYKGTYSYAWVQYENEPYTIEISRNGEKWLASLTFEDDDHALVDFHIVDRLPAEARKFIQERNKARNRPENEFILRFRRVEQKK